MFKSPALKQTRRASNNLSNLPNLAYNNPEPYNERKVYNPRGRPYLPMPIHYYMNAGPPENVVVPNTTNSWKYFPTHRTSFRGNNPMALMRYRNKLVKNKADPYFREQVSHNIATARHQVFPVAARKTRRKNRKTRKSRR
jgi:hypothetical protein